MTEELMELIEKVREEYRQIMDELKRTAERRAQQMN